MLMLSDTFYTSGWDEGSVKVNHEKIILHVIIPYKKFCLYLLFNSCKKIIALLEKISKEDEKRMLYTIK